MKTIPVMPPTAVTLMTIKKISGPDDIVKRLSDLGFYPDLQIEIIQKISFSSVTVVQFNETILALNQEEMSCLHGS